MEFKVVRACISSSSHFNLQRFSSTGILAVPDTWKKAEIIPVPKIKVPNDITKDLRPISLIATLSKTCERFVADWLMELIKEKIDKRQFGSVKNSSTTHALLSLVHHLLNETDVSKNAVRIFLLDFSKAFDYIDHNILLRKLEKWSSYQS